MDAEKKNNTTAQESGFEPVASSRFNVDKHKKRVDQTLASCQEKMAEELGSLLGIEVALAGLETSFVSKKDFFSDHVSGKQVIADMDVVGDLHDTSFFALGIRSAIHLGGLLIMLPASELQKVISEEDFGEDARDAYGEIANIVAGVYTSVFEEQYTKKLRFIRKSLQEVVPSKVESADDETIPNGVFYLSTMLLSAGGEEFGNVHMLFPVNLLQLTSLSQNESAPSEETQSTASKREEAQSSAASPVVNQTKTQGSVDSARHGKVVAGVLGNCQKKMSDELSELLGINVQVISDGNTIISKKDFFSEKVAEKQVVANIEVAGEVEDTSFLSISMKDAISIGGTLIALPDSELQMSVDEENFTLDMEDAYAQIVDIVSGIFTTTFEKEYTKEIRFVKTGLQQVVPSEVEPSGDEPIPDLDYYVSSMSLILGDSRLGSIHILLPTRVLQLEGSVKSPGNGAYSAEQPSSQAAVHPLQRGNVPQSAAGRADESAEGIDILLIGDDENEVVKLKSVLGSRGYVVRVLSFKDNVNKFISTGLKAVYLVTQDVDEQLFGVAIKVSSACSSPLIAAAPGWTKTKVIKAVKYGVKDILLTPANTEDIEENISDNLVSLTACP